METLIQVLPYIVTLILAIPGFRAYTNQKLQGEATLVKQYQEIARMAADDQLKIQLEKTRLVDRVGVLEKAFYKVCRERDALKKWAEKLVYQVKLLDGDPCAYQAPIEEKEEVPAMVLN